VSVVPLNNTVPVDLSIDGDSRRLNYISTGDTSTLFSFFSENTCIRDEDRALAVWAGVLSDELYGNSTCTDESYSGGSVTSSVEVRVRGAFFASKGHAHVQHKGSATS
jgi:hypothetical protein